MVTINQLMSWKPGTLTTVSDTLVRRRKALVDLQDEITGAKPPVTWVAGSAGGARVEHEKLRLRLNDLVAEVSDVAINLDDAQARITRAKNDLRDALATARTQGLDVDHETGRVKDPRTYTEDEQGERDAMATQVHQVAEDVDNALKDAQEADLDLATALQAAAKGTTEGGSGTLGQAAAQTPTRMDHISPERLAEILGDQVTINTITAYLEMEAEIGSFDFQGKVQGEYRVTADGTTFLALHLEAGLGREISVGGASADASAGGTTDLELKFDSPGAAQEFLHNLKDKALQDVGFWDAATGQAPAIVAGNVARYVEAQDVDSFRVGVYGSAKGEFDTPWARGAIEGRAEAYVDLAKDQVGLKLEGKADAELGHEGSGYDAAASMAGEVKIDKNGHLDSLTLTGKMSGTAANDRLGLDMPPHTSTGAGVDVQLTVDSKNPAIGDIKKAFEAGDIDRAKDLALDNGQLVVRQTTIEKYAVEDHDVDFGVGEVKIGWGASGETANQLWFRPAGDRQVMQIDPRILPVNGGGH